MSNVITPVQIAMTLDKETKTTYRFKADDESAPIPTVYVAQTAFDSKPTTITLTIG